MLNQTQLKTEINHMLEWFSNYVHSSGSDGVVIGNSGGKDSATVIAIATHALGKEHVLTVAMPCFSLSSDLDDAKLVADTFRVPLLTVDLTETNEILKQTVSSSFSSKLTEESCINIKPRLRMTTLYSIAQTLNYLVVGTSNLCERMVGYTTKWGDSASDLNPIADFTVEEVRFIGSYLGVPDKIIHKSPNDGLGGKSDEEKMGILYSQISEYIETGITDPIAMKKIEKRYLTSYHKRSPIPTYPVNRKNYLNFIYEKN